MNIQDESLKTFREISGAEPMFRLEGPFGKRIVGMSGGWAEIRNVDKILRKLSEIDKRNGTTSQILNASRVAGKKHLLHATRLALIAQVTGRNFTQSLDIELICWIAGLRQIERALERVGIHEGEHQVALLTVGKSKEQVQHAQEEALKQLGIRRNDSVLGETPEKIRELAKAFSISKHELETAGVGELVLERVSLLSLQQ